MRIFQIFLVLGFPIFALASISSQVIVVTIQGDDLLNEQRFSLAPKGSRISCSLCQSPIGSSDIYRESCQHGYHISCFHNASKNREAIGEQINCQECKKYSTYLAFMAHNIFYSPIFPEGITCIPELMDLNFVLCFWLNAMLFPNTTALERLIKIKFPFDVTVENHNVSIDLIGLAAPKATTKNLNFLLDSGLKLCTDERYVLIDGFISSLINSNFKNAAVFLERGLNINEIDKAGRTTALLTMISIEKVDAVKFLIDNNADLNFTVPQSASPLFTAIEKNNAEILELLLKSKKVDIRSTNAQERFPIQQAIFEGKLNSLCALLDNRVPAEVFTTEGYSLLQYAIALGSVETVKFLYSRRFAPITLDGNVSHVLQLAVTLQKTETVLYLLSIGISPYEQMITPVLEHVRKTFPRLATNFTLHDPAIVFAILVEDFVVFKALLDAGTNPNTKIFGNTCALLHLACDVGNAQMAKYLIQVGADTNVRDSDGKLPSEYNSQEFFNQLFYD